MKELLEDNLSAGVIPWAARATLESSEYSLCCLSSVEVVILEMHFEKSYPKPLFMRVAHVFIFEDKSLNLLKISHSLWGYL